MTLAVCLSPHFCVSRRVRKCISSSGSGMRRNLHLYLTVFEAFGNILYTLSGVISRNCVIIEESLRPGVEQRAESGNQKIFFLKMEIKTY